MFLSLPSGDGILTGAIRINDRAGGEQALSWATGRPLVGRKSHIVWATDSANHLGTLYVDGLQVGVNTNMTLVPADIGTMVNNWVGRSQYGGDAMFNGTVDELRIWDGPIQPLQVAINAATGPESTVTDPGALQAVRMVAPEQVVKGGQEGVTVYADYQNVTNVNVGSIGTVFSSSDTNVATVTASGVVTGLKTGNSTITATYQGKTDTKVVNVVVKPVILANRWSFNETTGTTVTDSIGNKTGTLEGGATLANGEAVLDGVSGYVALPANLISGFEAVTFESWVNVDPTTLGGDPARLYAFGSVAGVNELAVTPLTGDNGNSSIRFFGPPNLSATRQKGFQTLGKIHLVTVFNPPLGTIDMFIDGSWQNSATNLNFSLAAITNTISRLGANFDANVFTVANFDEFRIYNGALDLQGIRASLAAGPNALATNLGSPTALTLDVDATMVQGSKQVPHPRATFASVSNVDLTQTDQVSYTSSNPGVIAVTSDGLLHAVAAGSAQVTASLGGASDTEQITVFPKQTMLTHRYSFTNDATDSVGAQDGSVWGNAVISDGQVNFDGDMNSYVELPSRMISTYDAATIEVWASFGVNQIWSRVYDFGHYNPGGDGGSRPYAFLCPHTGGATTRVVLSTGSEAVLDFGPALDGYENLHMVVVYDPPNNTQLMYTNGVLAGSSSLGGRQLSGVDDLKCWIGRSMYAGDNGLTGSINEFRIYAGAFTPAQVGASLAAGPNTVALLGPVVGAPSLTIEVSGANLLISWPDSATGYNLQTTGSLGPATPNWSAVSTAPVQANGQFTVTLPVGTGTAFYRLTQ